MIAALRRLFSHQKPLGAQGEQLAARYLRKHAYRILARNVRNRFGEIDLIVQPRDDAQTVVFVEVKAGTHETIRPEVHVNRDKQRRIVALSAQILRKQKMTDKRVRYDVVAVDLRNADEPVIRHYEGAFESYV